MLELEDALARILATMPTVARERVPLTQAPGRVLAEKITSTIDLPRFDNSAMDGYAVRAANVAGAKLDAPVRLRVRGRIPAGENFTGELVSGECARLFTGSLVPLRAA